jgi:hypothetical protein
LRSVVFVGQPTLKRRDRPPSSPTGVLPVVAIVFFVIRASLALLLGVSRYPIKN